MDISRSYECESTYTDVCPVDTEKNTYHHDSLKCNERTREKIELYKCISRHNFLINLFIIEASL
jgi:hypothetical protein